MQHIKKYISAHKIISVTSIIVLALFAYWGYGKLTDTSTEPRYVTALTETGSIITSISGTGQVSASNQVELKSRASGDIVAINVVNGQEVGTGALIAQLDAREAQKVVRDAEVNLQSAKLSLEKLKKPANNLSVIQAENALAQAQQTKQNAEDDLKKAYDDGFNGIANTFLDLPTIMTGLDDIFFDATIDQGMPNINWYINQTSLQIVGEREKANQYQNDFYAGYNASRTTYAKNFDNYKAASRTSSTQIMETLVDETYTTTRTIADAVKTGNNLIDFVKDSLTKNNVNATIPATVDAHKSTLNTYTGTTNTHLLNLLATKNTIKNSKDAITNADRTIAEKTEYIADLKAGTDQLDLQAQELIVRQRENALLDAREKLADYY
ncbi:MAG: Efflux transporter, RND family, MFP subunit, partial [Candidatus Wolfebacteria bacterium GW2011_GWE1_48_7]